ncbi:TPA: hypothetical protein ACKP1B_005464 [Serratia fonticola]
MKISASVYAADPRNIIEQITPLLPEIVSLHFDVMDGHFAPAYGLNLALFQRLQQTIALPIDVHLMIANPEDWALRFADLGARWIAVHPEACRNPKALLRAIRQRGSQGFLAISTTMAMSDVAELLPESDGVLILSAPAGGGEFMPNMLHKARAVPDDLPVVYDGKMQKSFIDRLRNQPNDLMVIGGALFNQPDAQSDR